MSRIIVAVSLKMYFPAQRTLAYAREVSAIGRRATAAGADSIQIAMAPDFLTLDRCAVELEGSGVWLCAQNVSTDERGALTGEISAVDLKELGCRCVEIGHAERRTQFCEDDATVAAKVAVTLRNHMVPLICVGDSTKVNAQDAAQTCCEQAIDALSCATGTLEEVWIAYEPYWAIGAAEAAEPDYVATVCETLREELGSTTERLRILYGGAAGPGTLSRLYPSIDGVFLGRYAHNPSALEAVVDEAIGISSRSPE